MNHRYRHCSITILNFSDTRFLYRYRYQWTQYIYLIKKILWCVFMSWNYIKLFYIFLNALTFLNGNSFFFIYSNFPNTSRTVRNLNPKARRLKYLHLHIYYLTDYILSSCMEYHCMCAHNVPVVTKDTFILYIVSVQQSK